MIAQGSEVLSDLEGFHQFKESCQEIIEELQEFRQDSFQQWSEEMLSSLDDPNNPVR